MTRKLGTLARQYHFSLNPYTVFKFTTCPDCKNQTGQRKLPLLIHVMSAHMIAMNYTNRYCARCDMLIGHKFEIEHFLTEVFLQTAPTDIGNEYTIIGTVEKKAWRESMKGRFVTGDMLRQTHDFKSYQVISMTMGGWMPRDMEPPVIPHPPSPEWVKRT